MLTWKVFLALQNPSRNDALYWHSATGDWVAPAPYEAGSISQRLIWLFLAAVLYLSMCGRSTVNLWIITLFSLLAGSVYGLIGVCQVTGKIAETKAQAIYDCLCLAPSGAWRVNWAICMGCLHRHNALSAIFTLVAFSTVVTSLHLLSIILSTFQSEVGAEILSIVLLSVIAIPALLFNDYAQSLVIASLIGMILPTYDTSRTVARLIGVIGFLTLQLSAYLLWIFLTVISVKGGNDIPGGWGVSPILAGIMVSILREFVVVTLTLILRRRLDWRSGEWGFESESPV